jgi:D-glycero-D-manno-heptose 1,7-bisphosphate phosphatase
MIRPAIFLDRDGVINVEPIDYVKSWGEFTFLPGSLQALKALTRLSWPVIVVTNQAGIGRGLMTEQTLLEIHANMLEQIHQAGGRIDAIYYCPHHPDDHCSCRKPLPGMFLRAAQDLRIDLSCSYMIGDTEKDLYAAHAAGCYPVFVESGLVYRHPGHLPFGYHACKDLAAAAAWLEEMILRPKLQH